MLVCAHFATLDEALQGTLIAMRHAPYGCELMDKFIMDCTKENRNKEKNRFFLEGDPGAILIIEFRGTTRETASGLAAAMIEDLKQGRLAMPSRKFIPRIPRGFGRCALPVLGVVPCERRRQALRIC